MASHSGVPLAGLDILPFRTLLEVNLTSRVEHMEMNHRVQQA
jgi:hypothetical protein